MRRFGLLLLLAALASPAAAQEAQSGAAEEGGLRIAWHYAPHPQAEGIGTLDVEVAEAATGAPLRYPRGRLAAWLQRRRAALPEAEISCAGKMRVLATQGIGRRADIDLNTYRLLTLNTDGTLAVINPFVPLNNAKLEAIVELGGMPRNWLLVPERMEAWVVLAEPARLIAVDLQTHQISRAIDLPANGGLLAWEAATRRLWLGVPGRAGFGLIEPDRTEAPLQHLEAPPPVALLADVGLPGPVSLHADGTVILWTGITPARRWRVDGGRPHLIRYSGLARRLLVAAGDGTLAWLDPAAPDGAPPVRKLALGHPVMALAIVEGRHALALGGGRASLVDLATGEVTLHTAAPVAAEELLLTDRFVYAANAREGRATLWPLAALREGRAEPVEVSLGSPTPDAAQGPPRLVPTPAGNGVLAANPADGMIYQYGEGMMAPIGSYSNYRRAALGLLLLDLSLLEVAPGHYRSAVRHARGGLYELVLAGINPRFTLCAGLRLAPTAATAPLAERVPRAELVDVTEGGAPMIRVRLRETGSGAPVGGVGDLVLLLFDRRSAWQARVPMHEAGRPGEYAAEVALPVGARPEAMVTSASRNLSFVEGRIGPLRPEGAR